MPDCDWCDWTAGPYPDDAPPGDFRQMVHVLTAHADQLADEEDDR